jgi:uncharacterized protein YcsI (UPF0317 family)
MVVSVRPIPKSRINLVRELSARYPHAHGAPIHAGDPKAIGIADLSRPDTASRSQSTQARYRCSGPAASHRRRLQKRHGWSS